jgi:signal transduction histidine kinase
VAAVATAVIGLLYVAVAASLDAFLARRVLWEVDQSLKVRLVDVAHSSTPLAVQAGPADQGADGAPVFLWWLPPSGFPQRLTDGEPQLPLGGRAATAGPRSVAGVSITYRLEATPLDGGWLVAGQNLAAPSHIEGVLRSGELVIGPVVLAAVFVGALVIGLGAAAPVEQARRRLLEFTADASHELRTPLTVIEAEIELARSGPPDPEGDRLALDHVARESRRLKQIVDDLLWLARSDSAPPTPVGAPADLVAAVDSCAERFMAVAGGRGITLSVDHLGAAAWIDTAPEWVDRLAGTLLDNACRYTPEGGAVRVSVGSAGGRAVLRVEDSGPGIPAAERARLFDRFKRASDTPGGAGLGLAIADSVVRSTGGRWRVGDSALGGALMEVTWRRSTAAGREPGPSPDAGDAAGSATRRDLPSTVGP